MTTSALHRSLLLGCALGASVAGTDAARAQAVNATPNTVSGTVVYSRDTMPTPGSETIEVQSQSAIIDWTPPSVLPPGPYVFLPDGNVLTFINGIDNPNFVVLNRILTLQPSRFDGTVVGRLRADATGPERPGGTILFSSPGGIIVGPTALFDVGNLVLTTLNVVADANFNFVTPTGGFRFDGGENAPNAAVVVEPGARILATAQNSYVALVAPRIEHRGTIDVNGSAAFIAGEQLEFSVNQGLFDINIAVGSDNPQPIVHTGTTGGPASTGGADNHGIYFVAVPKNQAITMLLQGSVGFAPATDVTVENGVIVLSAGHNVSGGAIVPGAAGPFESDIAIGDAAFTSDTVGRATGDIAVAATAAEPASFAGSLDLDAGGRIDFAAADGAAVDVGQDLSLTASAIEVDAVAAGGGIMLDSTGDIVVGTAAAGDSFLATAGGSFTGGTVTAQTGGDIVVAAAGDLRLDNGAASGLIQLTSTGGSVLSDGLLDAGTSLQISAAADIDLADADAGDSIDLVAAGGGIDARALTAGGILFAVASGRVAIETATSGSAILVNTTGDADLGFMSAGDSLFVTADDITLIDATAGTDIGLTAGGDIQLGTARAGDDFTAEAGGTFTGGTVVITGLGFDNEAIAEVPGEPSPLAGSNIAVEAAGDLRLDNGEAPGSVRLTSTGGSILSDGTLHATRLTADTAGNLDLNDVFVIDDLELAAANGFVDGNNFESDGDIEVEASGDVTLNAGAAGGSLTLTSTGGSVVAGNALPGGGGSDQIGGGGGGRLSAGTDILVTAARDVTLGDADADESIVVDAAGLATFRGEVAAPEIAVTSADIDIAATGALGGADTELVALTVRPTGAQTVLGGGAEGPGYTLTDAEAARIRAGRLRIAAPAAGTAANRAPDLVVRDLSLSANRTGTVEILTPGIAQIEGELLLADAGAANGIDVTATERLQIVTPTGAVRVRDDSGMTAGFLNLTSNNLWSASAAILQQLLADPNFEGRDFALTLNTGPFNPRGSIEAGDVSLFVRDTLFVQNSGGIVDFAGITVRENTLTIVPTGAQPLVAFAFGRRINPDGSFVTGNAFFAEVAFQRRGTGYTDQSQLNLCFINSGVCRLPAPDDPVPGGPEIIERPVGGPEAPLPPEEDLVDTSFGADPLVDEPVTSGSDAELWDCDRDDDGDCDEDDGR